MKRLSTIVVAAIATRVGIEASRCR